jgi:N-acetylglucosaminyldiphosphoundecaprenol N-acetyl-beta-D-mannosaminyltransferase
MSDTLLETPLCALPSAQVVSIRVDATSYPDAVARILRWAELGESRSVYASTVNNVIRACDDQSFHRIMHSADLITPDGMPLVWALRLFGIRGASRVYGPDLTLCLLAEAERSEIPVAFYGSSPDVLDRLLTAMSARYPRLRVNYAYSPPFGNVTPEEDHRITGQIVESGACMVFVGLGSPKQERWIDAHRGRILCPMIGIGAAFDFLSGSKSQAPRWMMRSGLEWFFRLIHEPRRLWRRYLAENPRFLLLLAAAFMRRKVTRQL